MKANSYKVWSYLKENHDKNLTSADVAEACGLTKRQVDGIFNSALQRKQLGLRVPDEIQNEDGTHTKVKYLKLTEEGLNLEPEITD